MNSRVAILLVLLLAGGPAKGQSSGVRLNEFMASNLSAAAEMSDFGDFEDWIELVNTGTGPADVSGYHLSDDEANPTRWTFPPGTVIGAGGYLVIWADGRNVPAGVAGIRPWWPGNRRFTTHWNHTSFGLSLSGETLILTDPAGTVVDRVDFGPQRTDISLGRWPDGAGDWVSFAEPTPGLANTIPPLASSVSAGAVTLDTPPGLFTGPLTVTLTASGSGAVHYSLDGSRPNRDSPLYAGPIALNQTTVVRARVLKNGAPPGPVATGTFLIEPEPALPVVSLAMDPALLWDPLQGMYLNSLKEREIPAHLELFRDGQLGVSIAAGARIGGENIFRFAQKPINLYFRSEYGASRLDHPVFRSLPVTTFKRLYLRNGGDDWPKTLFRDGMQTTILSPNVRNAMQAYEPVALFLNGAWWGIHNLREKVDEQYFESHFGTSPVNLDHLESTTDVLAGDSTDYVLMEQLAAASDLSDDTAFQRVIDQIDEVGLMDFVIAQSFVANTSWGHNREMWRDGGQDNRWRWVLVDLDRGFEVSRIGYDMISEITSQFGLVGDLLENAGFRQRLLARYALHANTTFRTSRVLSVIDSLAALLAPEIPRHAAKWGPYVDSLSIPEWGIEPGIQSEAAWRAAVEDLRLFARERPQRAASQVAARLDADLVTGGGFGVEPRGAGRITSQDVVLPTEEGLWFNGVPVLLNAEPSPGFRFNRWVERREDGSESLVPRGSLWRYLDGDARPASDWIQNAFDDGDWSEGMAEFGYGDGDETTVISYGPNAQDKALTAYFRTSFEVPDPSGLSRVVLDLVRDDGAAVYLNGELVVRSNLPGGALSPETVSLTTVGGADESALHTYSVDPAVLRQGTNVLAVEVHQASGQSSDLSFDLALTGYQANPVVTERVLGSAPEMPWLPTASASVVAFFEPDGINRMPDRISGQLALTTQDSPVLVQGTVRVLPGAALILEAGVTLTMAADASIVVDGRMQALGTIDNPVVIRSARPDESWRGLCFGSLASPSTLANVDISGSGGGAATDCPAAISTQGGAISINGGRIHDVEHPVSATTAELIMNEVRLEAVTRIGDYVTIRGGRFEIRNSVFLGNDLPDMDGIDIGDVAPGTLVENTRIESFTGFNSDGIDLGEGSRDVLIRDVEISRIGDKGISIGQGSSALISGSTIGEAVIGVGIKDSLSFAAIDHSTFFANQTAVQVFEKNPGRGGAAASVDNSLFAESEVGHISADLASSVTVRYSLFDRDAPPGTGVVQAPALLVDPSQGNFRLQWDSPAIDAADPDAALDSDGSRSDIGAYPWAGWSDGPVVINEINYHSSSGFNPGDWAELFNRSSAAVDLSGWVLIDDSRGVAARLEGSLVPGAFQVAARDPGLFMAAFPGVPPPASALLNGLKGSGDVLYLYTRAGVLTDSVRYSDTSPWPTQADGGGATLELVRPDRDNASAANWAASIGHGTPGARNSVLVSGLPSGPDIPAEFSLDSVYPNPSRGTTTVHFALPVPAELLLAIYDVLGRRVAVAMGGPRQAGHHSMGIELASLPSGAYILRMEATTAGGHRWMASRTLVRLD